MGYYYLFLGSLYPNHKATSLSGSTGAAPIPLTEVFLPVILSREAARFFQERSEISEQEDFWVQFQPVSESFSSKHPFCLACLGQHSSCIPAISVSSVWRLVVSLLCTVTADKWVLSVMRSGNAMQFLANSSHHLLARLSSRTLLTRHCSWSRSRLCLCRKL